MAALDPLDDAPAEKLVHALGNKAADYASRGIGSWRFVIIQTIAISAYVWFMLHSAHAADPYPFVFLNLLLSFQAAYTGPVLLVAANHQAAQDRLALAIMRAEHAEGREDVRLARRELAEIKALLLRNGGAQ